jgi:drug/metabolite transporter (DMT)-like permease
MAAASLLLAVAAAGCNATSSVLQRKANREQPASESFGVRLLLDLLRNPQWLLGSVAMVVSFLLQAAALDLGTLSAVEPVLVLELPITFILAAIVFSQRLPTRDWVASAMMAGGLALFIAVLAPSGGDAGSVSAPVAVLATIATAAGIAALLALGHYARTESSRAALFGIAAGSGFGLTASLIKVSVTRLTQDGVVAVFTAWETYGFIVAGVTSVIMVQAALHAGTLVSAQPGITLLDPLVSLFWGTIVLEEATRTGPILLLAALGGGFIVVGVLLLVRSSTGHYAPMANAESSS